MSYMNWESRFYKERAELFKKVKTREDADLFCVLILCTYTLSSIAILTCAKFDKPLTYILVNLELDLFGVKQLT